MPLWSLVPMFQVTGWEGLGVLHQSRDWLERSSPNWSIMSSVGQLNWMQQTTKLLVHTCSQYSQYSKSGLLGKLMSANMYNKLGTILLWLSLITTCNLKKPVIQLIVCNENAVFSGHNNLSFHHHGSYSIAQYSTGAWELKPNISR